MDWFWKTPYDTRLQFMQNKNVVFPVVSFTKIGQLMFAMFVFEIEGKHTEKWNTSGVPKRAKVNIDLKMY